MDAKLAELVALYERVDALYADWSCPGSTECCRFGITGRQPYVTAIELSLLRHALAGRGGPLSPRRRALPLQPRGPEPPRSAGDRWSTEGSRRSGASLPDERTCPLLDRSGRCAVYAARPLGCRTFYCDRAQRGVGPAREELRELVRELQDLAARHQLGGELARPLTHALEAG